MSRRRLAMVAVSVLIVLGLATAAWFKYIAPEIRRSKLVSDARWNIANNGGAISKGPTVVTVWTGGGGGGPKAFGDQQLSAIIPSLSLVQDFGTLDLHETSVTDAGVAQLATLNELQTLDVSDTPVTIAGLLALQRLPKLWSITISPGQLSETDMAKLNAALPSVKKDFRGIGPVLLRPPATSPATQTAALHGHT